MAPPADQQGSSDSTSDEHVVTNELVDKAGHRWSGWWGTLPTDIGAGSLHDHPEPKHTRDHVWLRNLHV